MPRLVLTGWRYGVFFGSVVAAIGVAMYPIFIHPLLNIEDYKKMQAKGRAGINQEAVQPGGMKVWSDPFNREKSKSS